MHAPHCTQRSKSTATVVRSNVSSAPLRGAASRTASPAGGADGVGGRLERRDRCAEHLTRACVERSELFAPVRNIRPLFVVVKGVQRLVQGVRVAERPAAHSTARQDTQTLE